MSSYPKWHSRSVFCFNKLDLYNCESLIIVQAEHDLDQPGGDGVRVPARQAAPARVRDSLHRRI